MKYLLFVIWSLALLARSYQANLNIGRFICWVLTYFINKHFIKKLSIIIAIIGGGIGGTSCAYFLRDLLKDLVKIDIYEGNKVGGRLATTIMNDGNEYETGGSVIHERNKYMSDFVNNFGKLFNT